MLVSSLLFLVGTGYLEFIVGLAISWAIGFFLARVILNKTIRPKNLNGWALGCGLLASPIILGLLIWILLWVVQYSK